MVWSLQNSYLNRQAPKPAAPAPAHALAPAAAPAPVDYTSAFNDALGAQRAGIERQFSMALGDISQREALAGQAVGALPGQLSSIYKQGSDNVGAATKSLDSAQQASGLRSFMPAQAQMAPLAAASSNDLAARQADVPLLQLAMQTEMSRQRGAVGQARIGSMADVDAQQASYLADLARAQAGQGLDQSSVADERLYQDKVRKDEQNFQLKLRKLDAGGDSVDPETGLSSKQITSIRKSQRYKDALSSLHDTHRKTGGFGIGPVKIGQKSKGHKPASGEEIYKKYRAYPQVLKVLIKDIPELAAYVAGLGAS